MPDYYEVSFSVKETAVQELLIALLSAEGYEGFEQTEEDLKAFISKKEFNKEILARVAAANNVSYRTELIPARNWNAAWESSFQPVVVNDFVAIRADFHTPIENVEHEIIITPKIITL